MVAKKHSSPSARGPGRPAKIVQFHSAKRRYFAKLRINGRTEYLYGSTEHEVLEKYTRRNADRDPILTRIPDGEIIDELLEIGIPEETIEDNPELVRRQRGLRWNVNMDAVERNPDDPMAKLITNAMRVQRGLPMLGRKDDPLGGGPTVPASKKRLSDCFAAWKQWREADGCTPDYVADVGRAFGRFTRVVGNKLVHELCSENLAAWRLHVQREAKKRSTLKWPRDQHSHVRAVLRFAETQHDNWGFPEGLAKWLDAAKQLGPSGRYVPKRANRAPLPADVFVRLLTVCDRWAATNPERLGRQSQRSRAKRLQAGRRRRDGVQWAAILRLAVNCALDNVDCTRIPASAIKHGAAIPHIDFPRPKSRRQVGEDVPRLTPLLPVTVAAVRRWMEFEPTPNAPTLFRTSTRRPYTQSVIGETFKRLIKAANVEGAWTFKHLRNVGPSLRKAAGLPSEMSDALLGHVTGGTSKFYEEDVGPEYLTALVDRIGQSYLGGETTTASGLPTTGSMPFLVEIANDSVHHATFA